MFAGEVSRSRSGFGAGETDRVEGVEVASPGLFKFSNLARREETGRCSWSFSMQGRKRAGLETSCERRRIHSQGSSRITYY